MKKRIKRISTVLCLCALQSSAVPIVTAKEELPQTIVYEKVMEFLKEDTGTTKKVLLIGYDGFTRETLPLLQEGAVSHALENGTYETTYAGGDIHQQSTSTAPGWASILTGKWGDETGVIDNTSRKPKEVSTFLQEAEKLGYQSSFTASWDTHFLTTYAEDLDGKETYTLTKSDQETLDVVASSILLDTSDVIFFTLEAADHSGHTIGYGNKVEEYVQACIEMDQKTDALLHLVEERSSVYDEQWFILITSDHGGIENNHGNQSEQERNTWLVTTYI